MGLFSYRKADKRFQQLKALKYFRFTDPTKLETFKKEIFEWLNPDITWAKSLTGPIDEQGMFIDARSYFADAEDLAEGGIGALLERLQPLLKQMNIAKLRVKEAINDKGYTLTLNDKKYAIYDEADLKSNLFWAKASLGLQTILNDLFIANRRSERAYTLYPGVNDSLLVVLTPEELKLLVSFGKEKPYDQQRLAEELEADQ